MRSRRPSYQALPSGPGPTAGSIRRYRPWNTGPSLLADDEVPVRLSAPGRSKIAPTAVAALVVAVAATVTSLWSSPATGGASPDTPATTSTTAATVSASASSRSAASGLPAGDLELGPGRSVLFVGRSAELNPRGGTAKSFACRAAASLDWACTVREGASAVVPATATADVVVVALVPADDATRVARVLDRLPAGLAGARLVFLGPIVADADPAAAARLEGVRRLAAGRGAVLVDPRAQGWVTAGTAGRYLSPGGGQLTGAGHVHAGGRLAKALSEALAR